MLVLGWKHSTGLVFKQDIHFLVFIIFNISKVLLKNKLKASTRYLVLNKFCMTIHHPQIRGKGQRVDFEIGDTVTSKILGQELLSMVYYMGLITDDFKVNKAGHVIHPEDLTEKKTAVWRKHFK